MQWASLFCRPRGLFSVPVSLQARWAMSRNSRIIEEEFDVSQFLEGCKGAFVAGA